MDQRRYPCLEKTSYTMDAIGESVSLNDSNKQSKCTFSNSMPTMYESEEDMAESRDEADVIPDPSTLLNLKRSLAWSQDEKDGDESVNSMMENDEADISSYRSSWSTQIDRAFSQNDDKENGMVPVHWMEHVPSQENLGGFVQ
eukprot:scaffold1525_cov142-Cylindrotheca_fusiformis.AAC.154